MQIISGQVDLTLKQEFAESKFISVLELVNMIGNITQTLNFEVQTAEMKNQQIAQMEMQNEKIKMDAVI
jgi:hypothetical protein